VQGLRRPTTSRKGEGTRFREVLQEFLTPFPYNLTTIPSQRGGGGGIVRAVSPSDKVKVQGGTPGVQYSTFPYYSTTPPSRLHAVMACLST